MFRGHGELAQTGAGGHGAGRLGTGRIGAGILGGGVRGRVAEAGTWTGRAGAGTTAGAE